jgi:hypothetical protein
MFVVKNLRTGKLLKDPITRKPHLFLDHSHAETWACHAERDSQLNATAFNKVRPSKYAVEET